MNRGHRFYFCCLLIALAVSACRSPQQAPGVANPVQTSQPIPMENEIAALRAAYSAFNRGDIDAAIAVMDPQISWIEPAEFPGGGAYHGREAAKQYLTQSRNGLAEGISEPEKFIVTGDRIVVFVRAHVRAKGSADWIDIRLADVYTFLKGKAIAMRAFANRNEALRWVGLPPSQ